MKQFLCRALTKAINHLLALDPESLERLHKLQGKTIAIELLPLNILIECVFSHQEVCIQQVEITTANTVIRGTPIQLMGVMLRKNNRQQFFADEVSITGNAELAQQVIALLDHLEIDWEEHISKIVGDVPAYQAGRFLRGVHHWLRNAEISMSQNIDEFIHEEMQWLPAREALQDFFNEIDTLRMDTDRMEAKIRYLQSNLNQTNPNAHGIEDEGNQ